MAYCQTWALLFVGFAVSCCCALPSAQSSSSTESCRVEVTLSPPWTTRPDNTTLVSVNLNIVNTGRIAIATPWVLTLLNSAYGTVQQTFNLQLLNNTAGSFNGQATNYFQTILPNGGAVAVGLIIAVSSGTGKPSVARVNGHNCTVAMAPPSPPSPPASGAIESAGQLTTSNGQIIGLDGSNLYLIGLNYFGFDDGNTMVDGLWVGSESITQDFATIVYRQQLLGFNAVRLPFSFASLYGDQPKVETYSCTQDSQSVITASTVAPGSNPTVAPPNQVYTPPTVPGVCNSYLPSDTTLNRFLWVVNFYASNNFYIILDNQFNLDQTAIQNTPLWVSRWKDLITQLTNKYPNAAARAIVDILNEPDAFNLKWQAQSGLPGYGDLALQAMDAIYPVNSGVLFAIEGAGQSGLAMNWGDGICTDESIISSKGISDPNPFFQSLLGRPYLSQVIAAPHVYPPSISKATFETQGSGLWQRLSQSFGYLNKQGYCSGGNTVGSPSGSCHLFPVIIGETGTDFAGSTDTQPQADFATWCNNQGSAHDGFHNAVSGVFWWAWNANSGDTKGIVEDDWQTIRWDKIAWLQSVGLKPWYAPGVTQTSMDPPPAAASPPPPAPVQSPPPPQAPASPPPAPSVASPPPVVFASNPPPPSSPNPNGFLGSAYTYPGPPSAAPAAAPSGGAGIEDAGGPTVLSPLTTKQGQIYGVDGNQLSLLGVTWYGFDNGTMLAGLQGANSISQDFATQVQRIIALGFNSVELPFSFKALLGGSPDPIPTQCRDASFALLMNDTKPPNIALPYGTMFPNLTAAPISPPNTCNSYIPSDTTLDRFTYIVNFLAENGLYVRLDNRLDLDLTAAENPQTWITDWSTLISALIQSTDTAARLLISPLTNPDVGGINWKPVGGVPGATNLYIELMDSLYQINPSMLYLIQGPSQLNLTGVPGSSYQTNIPVADLPLVKNADPNAFFKQVLVKPYANQVVIAPRVVAPSLAGTSNSATGEALFSRLTDAFGYLNMQGYCTNSRCKTFPIVVSGFGTPFATSQDSAFESDFVSWVTNANIANDGLHAPVTSFFWNGWDTTSYGALLSRDNTTLDFTTVDFLSGLGLSPWYFAPTAHRKAPSIPATYANTTVSGQFCAATASVSLSGNSNGTGDGTFLGSVAVTLSNLGNNSITPPWTVSLTSADYIGISQAFGLQQPTAMPGEVSGIAADTWNILWPESTNQVTLGFVVSATSQSFTPSAVQINGNNCTLTIGGAAAAAAAPASLTGGSVGGAESVAGATSLNQNTATDASSAGGVQPGPGAGTRKL